MNTRACISTYNKFLWKPIKVRRYRTEAPCCCCSSQDNSPSVCRPGTNEYLWNVAVKWGPTTVRGELPWGTPGRPFAKVLGPADACTVSFTACGWPRTLQRGCGGVGTGRSRAYKSGQFWLMFWVVFLSPSKESWTVCDSKALCPPQSAYASVNYSLIPNFHALLNATESNVKNTHILTIWREKTNKMQQLDVYY